MNKQQLASKIWESANKMRSKIDAGEYKDYILGFMFYKFLSDKQIVFLKEKQFEEEDIKALNEDDKETVEYIKDNIGYFISYNDLFSTWVEKGQDFDVSDVRDALSAFDRHISRTHKNVFNRIFNTLQTGLSRLGGTAGEQTRSIRELLHLLDIIPMDGKQDYDVLGFIYEYLISNFAVNAGKKAGEFYTPHEVSLLMSEIIADHLKDRDKIEIYDPTSGSGSLLINIGDAISKHMTNRNNIKYYAQELKENTYNLTRMNLVMRGILPDNIFARNADTLESDWPMFDETDPVGTYNTLYVDAVVSNPPYSQSWDQTNKETDPRYASFGLAPKSKADYAFLLHDLFHLKQDGIMTIVLPHGVLFRGGQEGLIRKNLIEKNHIDAIIGLPANIFFGTGIPTTILVIKQKRINNDILIVDASKGFTKVGNKNELKASDIKKVVDTVINRESIDKYSRVVSLEEIRENEYNLNIPRYVDSSEEKESWDIYSLMNGGIPKSELKDLDKYWKVFPSLKKQLFYESNNDYLLLKDTNIKNVILNNKEVKSYTNKYINSFDEFKEYLTKNIINKMTSLNISSEKEIVSKIMFENSEPYILIDKYKAYQSLDDQWTNISLDLEIIQTEGTNTIVSVDHNMVVKKRSGVDVEIQEGWRGKILPFELVQQNILINDLKELELIENKIIEIDSKYEELIESLQEEEKEDVLNSAGTAFLMTGVREQIKSLDNEIEEEKELKDKLDTFLEFNKEEKALKKELKTKSEELHLKTKEVIEELSEEAAVELLKDKWITPLETSIKKLPNEFIDYIVNRIDAIAKKYETTLSNIEEEIKVEEKKLLSMIKELEGNEFDMIGLNQLKKLLKGDNNG